MSVFKNDDDAANFLAEKWFVDYLDRTVPDLAGIKQWADEIKAKGVWAAFGEFVNSPEAQGVLAKRRAMRLNVPTSTRRVARKPVRKAAKKPVKPVKKAARRR